MYEHNALGYWSGLALCLTKVRSSRARCPATALIIKAVIDFKGKILSQHLSPKLRSSLTLCKDCNSGPRLQKASLMS